MKLTTLLIAIEVGGTVAFAMSGLIEAMRKRMDVVGVFSVAFVSAFGGGMVRDILLDRRPLFWIEHEAYLWLVFAMVVSAPWWLKVALKDAGARLMEWADAFGLGLFAISGTTWLPWVEAGALGLGIIALLIMESRRRARGVPLTTRPITVIEAESP